MSDVIIHVDQISKRYQIGAARQRYVALRDVLTHRLKRLGGRLWRRPETKPTSSEEFWALRDVSFEVKQGECVGIIGRNGAGKSTLLKILSRITEPTSGEIRMHGRVGSLLEVGTGFHPELTGRENIFLNGAILGMARKEISRKFDEIVAFAEVEKFLDTPVKYYSSGMYMRLAFAVAAHLEPEILIVDEVLAVGDAQFQKKCLGKMGEVAKGGRTVLFVSHNMQAVSTLTNSVVFLQAGKIVYSGHTLKGIAHYTSTVFGEQHFGKPYVAPPDKLKPHVASIQMLTSETHGEHICGQPIEIEIEICLNESKDGICFSLQVCEESGKPVCHFWLLDRANEFNKGPGNYRFRCFIPKFRLYMGRYSLTTWLTDRRGSELLETISEICPFEISMRGIDRAEYNWTAGAMAYYEDFAWGEVTHQVK